MKRRNVTPVLDIVVTRIAAHQFPTIYTPLPLYLQQAGSFLDKYDSPGNPCVDVLVKSIPYMVNIRDIEEACFALCYQ